MNKAIPIKSEHFNQDKGSQQQMRTDNTMMKPQIAWWGQLDNSYYPFVPLLDLAEGKPNSKYSIPENIVKAIKDKVENP